MDFDFTLDAGRVIGRARETLYGGFVEHLGRSVYGGVYDPNDPTADSDGFRQDVIDAVRELRMPITRYPGGCFTDIWRWEDGVGSVRKRRLDPAWKQLEPNTFGLHEFVKWARKVNTEPMMNINIGLRNAMDAFQMVEYCNFPGGTYLSDLRKANGSPEPFGIKYFCLGNELYATWEFGQMDAHAYGIQARECAKIIKAFDPDIKLFLCGCGIDNNWNREVLEICCDYVDYLSLHYGVGTTDPDGQYYNELRTHEQKLVEAIAICDDVCKRHKLDHSIKVSIDEWIMWDGVENADGDDRYTVGRHLLEENYPIRQVLMAAAFISRLFHAHCDGVDIACVAQTINVIAPIRTADNGVLWKQGNFYPMYYASHYGVGDSLNLGGLPAGIHASAIIGDNSELALFITNMNTEVCNVAADAAGMRLREVIEAVMVHSDDEKAYNTPDATPLAPLPLPGGASIAADGDAITATMPPRSWACIRVKIQKDYCPIESKESRESQKPIDSKNSRRF